ncbi:phosphate ABC transporter permease PtsA [Bacteriovorax stolpii]|uniref:Phosphate transport system permease protein PstA n=1 Tax=Bacteriovorax stolpii TaxID=960 RepID=A0A2K9NV89_BACTC|nr:phosphate ABC transporter permease PstA [Bacteriovorax stolpii]AUN98985.1 phosphate ABC transporter, permease protein PstA [Bacteriovorax stolpii]QDK41019.1 phosphate ABC transporter permease PtsA [Bacteriovorax stolpii]TDP55491.1 phosphate ABC transporter membrane protein 2 (PhoT family) [Bacteriovorax stolpii]BDT29148.1 phosphate ABC transporter permease PstA [Bacteriovorax sp. HI3]
MNYRVYRKFKNYLFLALTLASALAVLAPLFMIIQFVLVQGASSLNLNFFTELPKPVGETGGGMKHAILGTIYLVLLGAAIAIPIGVTCGVYLSEFSKSKLSKTLKLTVDLMSGIPSIVIGIFAYLIVVVPLKSFSALAGGIALAIIMLPIIIKTSEEILKLVPNHIREAGLALGLPRWKVILFIVLKGSISNLLTGIILAISRAAGETAPLLFTAFGNMYLSYHINEPMASLPVQIYTYAISPFKDWQRQAWGGAFVLMVLILTMNLIARYILGKIKDKKGI